MLSNNKKVIKNTYLLNEVDLFLCNVWGNEY